MSLRPTRAIIGLLGITALSAFGACGGSAEDADTTQTSDAFLARWPLRHRRECRNQLHACLAAECAAPMRALRAKAPFTPGWFHDFQAAKACALSHCSAACSEPGGAGGGGSGGSGGSAGSSGSPGTGGSAGASVCDSQPNACQTCLCRPCETEVGACSADAVCAGVMKCGMAAGCSGVDCYFNADGSRGPCADSIDAAGGPASAPVGKALEVFRCAEENRSTCASCTQ